MRALLFAALATAILAAPADAKAKKKVDPLDEELVVLKDAPGRDVVIANCVMCHSLDYIEMNSPFIKKGNWPATVTKMIKVMGAPITPDDQKVIDAYLAAHYGVD